jgi:hypothetical protein
VDSTIRILGTDRLILEGLVCRYPVLASGDPVSLYHWDGKRPLFPQRGGIVRLMNCSIGADWFRGLVQGWLVPEAGIVPEIVNCDLSVCQLGLPAGGSARIRNCVLGIARPNVETFQASPARLEIDRCAFWLPEPAYQSYKSSIDSKSPVELTVARSVFVSPVDLLFHHFDTFINWTGTCNVFVKPFQFGGGRSTFALAQWQADRKTDMDSVELPPWEFDPAQWRILRDKSPGYQPRADSTDYGADIDRLIRAMKDSNSPVDAALPTPAEGASETQAQPATKR